MRISDWSSDVCSSDLKPHSAILQNSRATSLLLARRAGAYLSSHRLPPLPTAGRWRYRMTKLPILAALAAAFLAQPATAQPASAPRTPVVAHADLRSEERRVGQECVRTCRSRWARSPKKT